MAGTLLSQAPAPPRVRAAAFQMLATLPGVKAEGTAADPMGRTGRVISLALATTVPLACTPRPSNWAPTSVSGSSIRSAGAFWPSATWWPRRHTAAGHSRRETTDGKPRRLEAADMPDCFLKTGEVSSYQAFAVAEWTNTPPR
ncbi:hypothetical protein [Actinoallomurus soli]|uniref:hypothetical protein n=1 Tax=Actinoallomurus soli TaxID=2952535 RepID=UPI002092E492|nr:hypothetical protein [Actinoallomurus soli]MCO5972413.1 hypothetical protein [Actinoallomurus soli]